MRVDIKKTIQANGMTLQQVANVMGISRQTLNYHQNRETNIEIATLQRIADIVGCEVIDFFYQDGGEEFNQFKCPHCGKVIQVTK